MKKIFLISVLAALAFSGCSSKISSSASNIIFACGDDKVQMIDLSKSNEEDVKVLWQWSVKEATDIPEIYQKLLAPLDECKPIDKNSKLVLTSSGGACIILDIKTKKVLFYAKTPMAHSAEILPLNRIVVANSTHPMGNSIELYDINKPEKVIYKDSLYSGHGVVWNSKNQRLYALGYDVLREYSLADWESSSPALTLTRSWKLPDDGGHDLYLYDDGNLILTTDHNVWWFNISKTQFSEFSLLKDKKDVKSVNLRGDHLIYTIAEESWWTFNVYSVNPDKRIQIPGIRLYKARFGN